MRTAIIIVGGFLLWGVCLGGGKLFFGAQSSPTPATLAFVGLWFAAAATNLWVGVARAGYSFRDEFPIFLVIFFIPVLAAAVVWWRR